MIVHTFHGHVLTDYFGAARSVGFRIVERGRARVTNRIITPSEASACGLVALHVAREDQCSVNPYGFDLSAFGAAAGG